MFYFYFFSSIHTWELLLDIRLKKKQEAACKVKGEAFYKYNYVKRKMCSSKGASNSKPCDHESETSPLHKLRVQLFSSFNTFFLN